MIYFVRFMIYFPLFADRRGSGASAGAPRQIPLSQKHLKPNGERSRVRCLGLYFFNSSKYSSICLSVGL